MDRVLRRHRRRLAQIVVDQWLYKARSRLFALKLQKIVQKHQKILCFRALREVTISRIIKRKRKELGKGFYATARKRRCFNAWVAHCKLEIIKREVMMEVAKQGRRRRCWERFCVWYQKLQSHTQLRRQLLIAEHFWSLSLLSTWFFNWQLGVQSSQRKKGFAKLALGFWAHKRITLSWLVWKKSINLRHRLSLLIEKRNRRLLASLFMRWHRVAVEDLQDLQGQAHCALTKSLLQKSLRSFQKYTSAKSSRRCRNHAALCFHHDQFARCTYRAWHQYILTRREKRRLANMAIAHLTKKRVRSLLTRWRSYALLKKRQDSAARIYEVKLCSRCIQTWKAFVQSKKPVCDSKVLLKNQAVCSFSHVIMLLQYQNKLLQRGFLTMGKKSRRFSRRRQAKNFLVSRACCILRRCIQELKSAAHRHSKEIKEFRAISCNTEDIGGGSLLGGQVFACAAAVRKNEDICKKQARNGISLSTRSPKQEVSCLYRARLTVPEFAFAEKAPSAENFPPRMQGRRNFLRCSRSGWPMRKARLPPRRPSYLENPFPLEKELSDPKLIREELIWTEDLICSFDKLKGDILQKETELSILRERQKSAPGSDRSYQTEKIKFLEEKVMVLHERQSMLLPLVETLASRADALQRSFGNNKGNQILHLD